MDSIINEWLQTYDPINEIAKIENIHNERLSENVKNLALIRTGSENLQSKYITDKGKYKQYQYMLLLRSESESDKQKINNLNWLDDLSDWLDDQKAKDNLPKLIGKIVENVECANALTYEESEDGSESVYSLQIYFDVRKTE